jgi:hypothetical protein
MNIKYYLKNEQEFLIIFKMKVHAQHEHFRYDKTRLYIECQFE